MRAPCLYLKLFITFSLPYPAEGRSDRVSWWALGDQPRSTHHKYKHFLLQRFLQIMSPVRDTLFLITSGQIFSKENCIAMPHSYLFELFGLSSYNDSWRILNSIMLVLSPCAIFLYVFKCP